MASTRQKQEQARARKKAEKYVRRAAQRAAHNSGYDSIDMTGSESFISALASIMCITQPGSPERYGMLNLAFMREAQKHGGDEAAAEMRAVLDRITRT